MINITTAGVTPENVAQFATKIHVLDRRTTNLLGIFGPAGNLRALVRLPNGNVQEVEPGQRLGAGRIVAIDAEGMMVQKNGETTRISIPEG